MGATGLSFEVGLPAWTSFLDAPGPIAGIVVAIEVKTGPHLPKTTSTRATRSPLASGTASHVAFLGTSTTPSANSYPILAGTLTSAAT